MINCSDFFFSSRRRHTRWPRDWSSDVCSSDLLHSRGALEALRAVGTAEHLAGGSAPAVAVAEQQQGVRGTHLVPEGPLGMRQLGLADLGRVGLGRREMREDAGAVEDRKSVV